MAIDESPSPCRSWYGAPAYARPPAPVAVAPRPFDPDELPLEIDQTEEERAFAARLPARAFAPGGADVRVADGSQRRRKPATTRPRRRDRRPVEGSARHHADARAGL